MTMNENSKSVIQTLKKEVPLAGYSNVMNTVKKMTENVEAAKAISSRSIRNPEICSCWPMLKEL